MFDASGFFGFFGVVPTIKSADEVAGDAAQAFKFAFAEMLGVGLEVGFGGLFVGFFGDKFCTGLDKAGNVQDVVVFEICESLFGVFFGNFSVFFE